MKKLYLYIRLSDADDDLKFKTESESIANQRTLLYRFIRARREFDGYEVLKLKKGESVERGLKRLKKVLDKEGLIKKLRDDRYFEKPCVKARKKSQRARIRNRSRRGRMELN